MPQKPQRFGVPAMKKLGDCPRVSLLSCFRVFGVLRVSLLVGDKCEQHGDEAKGKRVTSSSAA
jgi:hypothetical protein